MPIFMKYEGIDGRVIEPGHDKAIAPASLAATAERSATVDMPDVLVTSWQSSATAAGHDEIHIESFSWGVSQAGNHGAAAIDWILEIDGIKGESESAAALDAAITDLLPADDGDAAAAIGSADWRTYRVSVDSIE